MFIVDLIFRRVILLFLIGTVLSFLLIDQVKLKEKTLNTIIPSAFDLKEFAYNPAQMDKDKLKDILIYYKFLYGFMRPNTYEKPAASGIVGYTYYYLGNEKKAIEYLTIASKLYEHSFWFYYDLGVIYYNEGHYDRAVFYFALAKEAYPYTIGFTLSTRAYARITDSLNVNLIDFKRTQEYLQQNLIQGAEYVKQLDLISKLFVENPDLKNQIERKKIDLKLF